MKRSLVLGVNGQDGSYLAETLLRRGHEVTGVGRDADSRYVAPTARFRYVPFDLRDVESLPRLVHEAEPDFAFHAAAVHGAAGFQYEELWRDMLAVNVATLHALLEHARKSRRSLRIIYAGSAKIFPAPLSGVIDEATPAQVVAEFSLGLALVGLHGGAMDIKSVPGDGTTVTVWLPKRRKMSAERVAAE